MKMGLFIYFSQKKIEIRNGVIYNYTCKTRKKANIDKQYEI